MWSSVRTTLFFIIFILGVSIAVKGFIQSPYSADSWLHLGVGHFVADHYRPPNHSDISFKTAAPSLEWISHSWLFDGLTYRITQKFSTLGAVSMLIALFILSLTFLNGIFSSLKIPLSIRLLAVAVGAIILPVSATINPLFILLPLSTSLLYVYLCWKNGQKYILYAIPLIFFLWANLAGGYIFIAGALILSFLLNESFSKTRQIRTLLLTFLVGFIASLFNPYGIRIWLYALTFVGVLGTNKWFSTLAGLLQAINFNNTRNTPANPLYVSFLIYSLFLLFSFAVFLLQDRQEFWQKTKKLVSLLSFLTLGFFWIRLIPLSTFLTLPLFALVTSHLGNKISQIENRYKYAIYGSALCLILSIEFLLFLFFTSSKTANYRPPKTQADLIQKAHLPPNYIASSDNVGYVYYRMYPTKAFVDARDDFYDDSENISSYGLYNKLSDKGFATLIKRLNPSSALLSKNNDTLIASFANDPKDWSLVYFDYNGYLFIKNNLATKTFLLDNALRYLQLNTTTGVEKGKIDEGIIELELFTKKYPDNKLALGQLASLYRFSNNFEMAKKTLARIPKNDWDFAVYTEAGRNEAAEGLCESAEEYFLKALDYRSEKYLSKTVLDLVILYGLCFRDQEKAQHYLRRYLSFPLPVPEKNSSINMIKKILPSLQIEEQ